ncbi:ThuA domain-containing protein [Amycolatopsis magusensis]|uniref:Glucose/arabinose dehydrogenase/type 1 glutamine amidotransferase n=1 Tax=Amycolatopsis magusensis TaxID=882444 RepID=A0ABS4PTJ4_9PSEU|nr:ThuA domain-containing protein [Amycolatopsis magusensis]MBP2182751.1 glucose/arabinose dehydrogenase/type 1 glutamine amidotransferase [Amycolatopsis magusensis]
MRHRLARVLAIICGVLVVVGLAPPVATGHPEGLHVLVFSETAAGAYRHDSIPAGITMIEQLAAQNEWELTKSENSTVFNDATLATFDVIVMLQTSGMVWDNDAQRAAVQKYVRGGGGIVAVHNATDMNIEQQFPWWDQMLGMTMTQHSATVSGTAKVADRKHPSGQGLPDRWTRTEEWYNFNRSARGDVHVLVTADESTYDAGQYKMGHDHPISWCRNFEGGRLWATGMGHQASSYSEPLFREHVKGGVESAGGKVAADCGPTVWSSFEKVTLDDNTVGPAALDIAKDGRVFYAEYGGKVKIFKPDTRTTVTAATINAYTGGEDGLTGLALDPNFATTRWIYLMYSPAGGTEHIARVSRFTVNGDTLDPASEQVIMKVPSSRAAPEPGHTGGYLAFGPNGNLYIGPGDDIEPFRSDGYAPIDERPGWASNDAQGTAANTNDLRGKILRIHPQPDGTYTIPSGNMFPPGTAKTKPEIYAMGFRNAFRFSVHPTTGVIYAADYAADAGNDNPNRGPAATTEWNIITSPGFYGWPYCVGDNIPYNDYNFATKQSGPKFNCDSPVNNSPNNTGLTNLPAARKADLWYGGGANGFKFPEMGDGGEAPMAFPAYQYDPGNPSATKFPEYFDQTPFFGEWSRNKMFEFRLGQDGKLLKINNFLSNLSFKSPMDAKFGPDGALYLLEWGSGFGRDNPDSGLYRIDYTTADRSPIATAVATPSSGSSPLAVQFSSAGSADPEGGPVTFRWEFGDGATSTLANPAHTYNARGQFNAKLTVTDAGGKTGVANVIVTSGNTSPTVNLSIPDGGMFDWGSTIPYTVTVTDPEDGTIDCTKVSTTPALGHDQHSHDLSPIPGCSGTLSPQTDSAHAEANVSYVADSRYTDKGATGVPALTGSRKVLLHPKQKQAEFFTGSSGVRVVSQSGAQSGARVGDISNNDWISFKPYNFTGINQVSVRLSSPSGGGTVELRAGSPTGALIASVPVQSTGGWDTYAGMPAVNVANPGGTTELFLVFKTNAANSYDIDSMTFTGPGVGTPGNPGTGGPIVGIGSKCVDVNGGSTTDGAKVQLWTCSGGANQAWTRTGQVFQALGKCLNANGTADGALVQLWTCNGSSSQNWSVQADGTLRNGGKCLDANGGASADGTQLITWTCNGGTNQRWTVP